MPAKKEIDRYSLAKYFLYGFIPAPATIFKGGKKPVLEPWRLDYSKKLDNWSEEEIKKETVKLLKKAVKKCLGGEKTPGILLSGGVDSGLVAAVMTEFIYPQKILAFNLGFKEKEADESEYAKIVAKHLGLKHYIEVFSVNKALDLLPKIGEILKEPMADPSILPTFFLFNFAKKKVKLALLGDGGDESFAGYPKHLAHLFLEKTHLGKIPLSFLAKFFSGKMRNFFLYASCPLDLRNQLWISPFSPKEVEELTGERVGFEDIEKYHQIFNGKELLDEAFFLDQRLTLPDLYLVKTKVASKAAGLKIGCPFLEKELVEFCPKIPFQLKLKGWRTKSLLKEIALKYLPKEVILRPKKGFGIPLEKWLNGKFRPLVSEMLSTKKIKKEGMLNSRFVKKILKKGNAQQIWTLLVFELWREKWLKN